MQWFCRGCILRTDYYYYIDRENYQYNLKKYTEDPNWEWHRLRAPFEYRKACLIVRSREVSQPRELYLELSDRSEIWDSSRQLCCWCVHQIPKRYDHLNYQSRGLETSRYLTKIRLIGYWNETQLGWYLKRDANAPELPGLCCLTVNFWCFECLIYPSLIDCDITNHVYNWTGYKGYVFAQVLI